MISMSVLKPKLPAKMCLSHHILTPIRNRCACAWSVVSSGSGESSSTGVGAVGFASVAMATSLLFAGGDGGEKNVSGKPASGCAWMNRLRQRRARLVKRPPFESGSFIAGITVNDVDPINSSFNLVPHVKFAAAFESPEI